MLLVNTYIGPSSIHGTGLFAGKLIPEGTRTWELVPSLDLIIPRSELSTLPLLGREQFLHYAYLNSNDAYVLCFDDARFCNHSPEPNTRFVDGQTPYELAIRDIRAGDEITINYAELDCEAYKFPDAFFMAHASAEALAIPRHQIAALVLNTEFSRVSRAMPLRSRKRATA